MLQCGASIYIKEQYFIKFMPKIIHFILLYLKIELLMFNK